MPLLKNNAFITDNWLHLGAEDPLPEGGNVTIPFSRLKNEWESLAKFPGHVKDRDQLMHDAKLVVDEGTITSHIKRIRRKFQAVDASFDRIDTVYGMGYRWKA